MKKTASVTGEQLAWLKTNRAYARIRHSGLAAFARRGTLRPDGTFIPESWRDPVTNGNGSFGVGVPLVLRRKR